jgi:hypothetical protein
MRDDRARALDVRVDRVVVRAGGLRPDAARKLGAAVADALPAALAGAASRETGAPRIAQAAAAALASRFGARKGGVS